MHLEIYEAKYLVIDRSVTTRPRAVNAYEFDLFNNACRNIYIDNTLYTADTNCVVCRKPGQIVHSVGNYDNMVLTLRPSDSDGESQNMPITQELLMHLPTFFHPAHINELKQIMDRIITLHQYSKDSQTLYDEICRFILLLLSDSFAKEPVSDQQPTSRIYKVTAYIEQHYPEKMDVAHLADLIHLDKYYFIKYFRKRTGMTPQQYLIQKRIQEAKTLLESVDLPVREISYMVGYANTTHFISSFTKIVGISPAQYRANFRLPDNKSDHFEKHI